MIWTSSAPLCVPLPESRKLNNVHLLATASHIPVPFVAQNQIDKSRDLTHNEKSACNKEFDKQLANRAPTTIKMGKLEKKEAKAPQPISSPTTRGGKSDKSLLALAPPVSESFDEQLNHHHGDVDLRMAAATIEEEIQRTAVTKMDKDSKKKAARISSHGASAAHQDIKKRPAAVHDTKQGKVDFVAAKQRISGGSAGRRDSRKKKSGASSTEAYAPGAVLIPGINSGQLESSSNAFEDDNMNNVDNLYDKNYDDYDNGLDVDDAGTFIVAAQVVDGENENLDGGKIETKIQEEVETRLKMHNQNLVVVDAVVAVKPSLDDGGYSSQKWNQKVLGLPQKVWCLLLIVVLLVVAIVTGVVVSSKSNNPGTSCFLFIPKFMRSLFHIGKSLTCSDPNNLQRQSIFVHWSSKIMRTPVFLTIPTVHKRRL